MRAQREGESLRERVFKVGSRRMRTVRGRPRDEHIDKQVVAAVLRVLRTRGYKAVTIDGIARTVKRARASIYRRWLS